jgi:chemotaxis signal transduction protein
MTSSQSKQSWVIAEVDAIRIGITAGAVQEIAPLSGLGRIPHSPPHLLGLALVRGEPIPVMDLGRFLDLAPLPAATADDERPPRVVTVATAGYRVGLAVARVVGVKSRMLSSLTPPEVVQDGRVRELSLAEMDVDGDLVALLDLDRVLSEARVRPR